MFRKEQKSEAEKVNNGLFAWTETVVTVGKCCRNVSQYGRFILKKQQEEITIILKRFDHLLAQFHHPKDEAAVN